MGCGLERDRRQAAAEIGLMEPGQADASGRRVIAQPGERQLIGNAEQDQRLRGTMPIANYRRVKDREIECRMSRLTRLVAERQIGADDEEQAGGRLVLAVRHECNIQLPAGGVIPMELMQP